MNGFGNEPNGFGYFGNDNGLPAVSDNEVQFEVNGESCFKIRQDLIEDYQVYTEIELQTPYGLITGTRQ